MQIIKLLAAVCVIIFTTGCSDTFLRAMDEFNAGMGGQRTCKKEATYKTDSYKGYSYKTGGLCNIWQGQIQNYSDYTVRCENTINGNRANTLYASPGETTEEKQIGYMSGQLEYNCEYWTRKPFILNDYTDQNYQVLEKLASGTSYITLKNTGSYSQHCQIENKNKTALIKGDLDSGQVFKWVRSPKGTFYTSCRVNRRAKDKDVWW